MQPHIGVTEQILQGIVGAVLSLLVQPPPRHVSTQRRGLDVLNRVAIGAMSSYLLSGIAVNWVHGWLPEKVATNPVQTETAINGAVGFAGWWIAGSAAAFLSKARRRANRFDIPFMKKDDKHD